MNDVLVIRHQVRALKKSRRAVAKELGVSRNTVARYLADDVTPGVRNPTPRQRTAHDALVGPIKKLLAEARTTRKQRLTAPVVVELLAKQGVTGAERTVRRVLEELDAGRREVFVPLEYACGDLAEVDFFEVVVCIDGIDEKAFLFVMRLMFSGRDFAWLYRWQDSACFLDGHVRAFAHFGAVSHRVLYDNLKPAVRKILVGRERELNERFAAMAAHYAYEPRFARPGVGHDKGGVESRGRAIRLRHLTPIPEAATLDAISERLLARLDASMDRPRRRGEPTIATLWEQEAAALLPLPACPHEATLVEVAHVDSQSQIRVKTARYSVPSMWRGLDVQVRLGASEVVAVHAGERVVHPRVRANGRSVDYRHYLREMVRKPATIEQNGDVLARQLGEPFERAWRLLVDGRGRGEAARAYKHVLRAVVEHGADIVGARMRAALERGEDPVLALRGEPAPDNVVPLPAALVGHQIEAASASAYDTLLGGSR